MPVLPVSPSPSDAEPDRRHVQRVLHPARRPVRGWRLHPGRRAIRYGQPAPPGDPLDGWRSDLIPNSEIRTVENLSKGWSRAVVEAMVAPEADERRVMEIFREMLENIHEDPEFEDRIVEPANILGMTAVEPNRLVFRAFIKTEPMAQFAIGRELQRRIRERLIAEDIPLPPRTIDIVGAGK
ncbi:MAG: mechanosensitive ion channel [Thermomicrobiales bacterium]